MLVRGLARSLQEHGQKLLRWWWALVVSGIGGVLGLIAITVPSPKEGRVLIPTWLWVTLLVGGIFVAQFLTFHDVRKERDVIKLDMERRFDSLRYRFQMGALIGGPTKFVDTDGAGAQPGYQLALTFENGALEPLAYEVESFTVNIGGRTASPGLSWGNTGALILPGHSATFFYHPILTEGDPQPQGGDGEYTIRYGHPSEHLRFQTHHRFKIGWGVLAEPSSESSGSTVAAIPRWTTIGDITHEDTLNEDPMGG